MLGPYLEDAILKDQTTLLHPFIALGIQDTMTCKNSREKKEEIMPVTCMSCHVLNL